MDNTKNYLDQVMELLIEGADLKTLSENTSKTERILREAKGITEDFKLPKPWPQLVDYRLAHVLLRTAKDQEDFLYIDELLIDAAKLNCLGPLPRLYRLAAMFRAGAGIKQMEVVFNALLEQIDHFGTYTESRESYDRVTALQNSFFNMLELAAYFTGFPYDGFEGKGRANKRNSDINDERSLKRSMLLHGSLKNSEPFSDVSTERPAWRLVGTLPGLASRESPGKLAIVELIDRMEKGELKPPCISFQISADKRIHEWNFNLSKKSGKFVWNRVRSDSNHLLFLSAICYHRKIRSRGDLLIRMFNDDSLKVDSKFRKWKKRCSDAIIRELIAIGTNINPLNNNRIFLDVTVTDGPIPEFQPEISVLGAMDSNITWY